MAKRQKKIIKEFQKEISIWYKGLPQELHNKPCPLCGIIPDNLLRLSKALKDIDQKNKQNG